MNNREFNEWLAYHQKAFPSLGDWLTKQRDPDSGDNVTLRIWAKALSDVSLDTAKRATEAIVSGETAKPTGWSEHPSAVRRFAREHQAEESRPTYVDGERAFSCDLCDDSGYVSVYQPDAMKLGKIERDKHGRVTTFLHTFMVACTCSKGDVKANPPPHVIRAGIPPCARLDKSRMCLEEEGPDGMVEFMTNWRPRNYSSTLDKWNERKDVP